MNLIWMMTTSAGLCAQDFSPWVFGTDTTLEVITWNIQSFPKNDESITQIAEILAALEADVIGVQEVADPLAFKNLIALLDDYDGYLAEESDLNLGFIYRKDLSTQQFYTIENSNIRAFPRAPLIMQAQFAGHDIFFINNHWKCCGDEWLDTFDPWDEESRRLEAAETLAAYVSEHHPNDPVILLGDLNDRIEEDMSTNVFKPFLLDTLHFRFADDVIAYGSDQHWSYPSWPSHLDHIIITDELFAWMPRPNSKVMTLRIDQAFDNGFFEYRNRISDHLPVGLRLNIPQETTSTDVFSTAPQAGIFPNPISAESTLILPNTQYRLLNIYDSHGSKLLCKQLNHLQLSWTLDFGEMRTGIYHLELISDSGKRETITILKK